MKTTRILLSMALASTLLSCSNDNEPSASPQNAVGFEAFVNKATKANDITMSNFKEFSVFGVMGSGTDMATLFDNTKVSLDGTDWTYSPLRYWVAGNDYKFAAIAPYESGAEAAWSYDPEQETAPATATSEGMGTITFNNKTALANQDLIYAYYAVDNAKSNQPPVAFTFSHLLSRVMFTFENSFATSGSYIEISDVTVTNVNSAGTIDMSAAAPAWTVTAGSSFARPFGLVTNNGVEFDNQGTAQTTWYYFIPANQTYTMTFTVKLYTGSDNGDVLAGTFEKTVTVPAVDMKQGYSYNFTASINEDNISSSPLNPIVFTVESIEDWENWSSGGDVVF